MRWILAGLVTFFIILPLLFWAFPNIPYPLSGDGPPPRDNITLINDTDQPIYTLWMRGDETLADAVTDHVSFSAPIEPGRTVRRDYNIRDPAPGGCLGPNSVLLIVRHSNPNLGLIQRITERDAEDFEILTSWPAGHCFDEDDQTFHITEP